MPVYAGKHRGIGTIDGALSGKSNGKSDLRQTGGTAGQLGEERYLGERREDTGRDQNTFLSIAAKAKAGCPVSKLIKVEIGFEATLSP